MWNGCDHGWYSRSVGLRCDEVLDWLGGLRVHAVPRAIGNVAEACGRAGFGVVRRRGLRQGGAVEGVAPEATALVRSFPEASMRPRIRGRHRGRAVRAGGDWIAAGRLEERGSNAGRRFASWSSVRLRSRRPPRVLRSAAPRARARTS